MIDPYVFCQKGCECGRGEWTPMFFEFWNPRLAAKMSYVMRATNWDLKLHKKAKTIISYRANLVWPPRKDGKEFGTKLKIFKTFTGRAKDFEAVE